MAGCAATQGSGVASPVREAAGQRNRDGRRRATPRCSGHPAARARVYTRTPVLLAWHSEVSLFPLALSVSMIWFLLEMCFKMQRRHPFSSESYMHVYNVGGRGHKPPYTEYFWRNPTWFAFQSSSKIMRRRPAVPSQSAAPAERRATATSQSARMRAVAAEATARLEAYIQAMESGSSSSANSPSQQQQKAPSSGTVMPSSVPLACTPLQSENTHQSEQQVHVVGTQPCMQPLAAVAAITTPQQLAPPHQHAARTRVSPSLAQKAKPVAQPLPRVAMLTPERKRPRSDGARPPSSSRCMSSSRRGYDERHAAREALPAAAAALGGCESVPQAANAGSSTGVPPLPRTANPPPPQRAASPRPQRSSASPPCCATIPMASTGLPMAATHG